MLRSAGLLSGVFSGVLLVAVLLLGVSVSTSEVLAQPQDAASQWADFNHYVMIARPDLAQAAAETLLKQVDNSQLLDIVEASDYPNYDRVLIQAGKTDGLAQVAAELEQRIQGARVERSRDPARITTDINQLAQGQRPYRNAIARLSAAGQWAAPQLLASLEDQDQARLHPYVMDAMVAIGLPLVDPLSATLSRLEPVTLGQVAQVLAQIGYPQPLPFLKQIIQNPDTDPDAKRIVEAAYQTLEQSAHISGEIDASVLFLRLGQQQYRLATGTGGTGGTGVSQSLVGFDPAQQKGIVWDYEPDSGLIPTAVPGSVYGDVLAMRSAKHALELNANLDSALSLFLMANFRRENRLPQGETDPSNERLRPASYYAMLAGPLRLHDVLAQALADRDADLALDAIEALDLTAGTDALVNRGAAIQPLLNALSYPDRRVRFRAAAALTNARPNGDFAGAHRVVPVLAEAVRQSENRYALVLAENQELLNELMAAVGELGFEVLGGLALDDLAAQVDASPGIDLIVAHLSGSDIEQVYLRTTDDYRLGAVPILGLAAPDSLARLSAWAEDKPRLQPAGASTNVDEIRAGIEQVASSYIGASLDQEQSTLFALTALDLLRQVASSSSVYRVSDGLPALVEALGDQRSDVVVGAGQVLALINEPAAQEELAQAALAGSSSVEDQVSLLGSLAESATWYGNMLPGHATDQLIELVRNSQGDVSIAAARAHGALTLPTSDAVKMILK